MTTQDGLDASGYLLLAKGHLVKAREVLESHPRSFAEGLALGDTQWAIKYTRIALELLKQEKEETCKKLESKSEKH